MLPRLRLTAGAWGMGGRLAVRFWSFANILNCERVEGEREERGGTSTKSESQLLPTMIPS